MYMYMYVYVCIYIYIHINVAPWAGEATPERPGEPAAPEEPDTIIIKQI